MEETKTVIVLKHFSSRGRDYPTGFAIVPSKDMAFLTRKGYVREADEDEIENHEAQVETEQEEEETPLSTRLSVVVRRIIEAAALEGTEDEEPIETLERLADLYEHHQQEEDEEDKDELEPADPEIAGTVTTDPVVSSPENRVPTNNEQSTTDVKPDADDEVDFESSLRTAVGDAIVDDMVLAGMDSYEAIRDAKDEAIDAIPGVGPVMLKKIREIVATFANNFTTDAPEA